MTEQIDAVRALHVPGDGMYLLECEGCEPGMYAESGVPWPCATANLVYTEQEITAITTETVERTKAKYAVRDAEKAAEKAARIARGEPEPEPSMLMQVYSARIIEQVESNRGFWNKFAATPEKPI